jgi:hypothetical protein
VRRGEATKRSQAGAHSSIVATPAGLVKSDAARASRT